MAKKIRKVNKDFRKFIKRLNKFPGLFSDPEDVRVNANRIKQYLSAEVYEYFKSSFGPDDIFTKFSAETNIPVADFYLILGTMGIIKEAEFKKWLGVSDNVFSTFMSQVTGKYAPEDDPKVIVEVKDEK